MIFVILCLLVKYISDQDPIVYGNNLSGCEYGKRFLPKVYHSKEEVIENFQEDTTQLFINETGNIVQFFFLKQLEFEGDSETDFKSKTVYCHDFYWNPSDGTYTYSGERHTTIMDSIARMNVYTWQETMRADAYESFGYFGHFGNTFPSDYDSFPLWGICESSEVYNVTISGQKIDDIIEINTEDGEKYYLWIIDDYTATDSFNDLTVNLNSEHVD